MKQQPKNYWRLGFASESSLDQMVANSSIITSEKDFVLSLQVGDGILLANFDYASCTGKVRAIGIVSGINQADCAPMVAWRRVSETLHPTVQGQRFWIQAKPYFSFASTVVRRYRLPDIFGKYFSNSSACGPQEVTSRASKESQAKSGGYVYLIKSQYGYKIGKTKRMKDRTQLFSVKLPFPIEVVHYRWFDDYSAAEFRLHQMFRAKRMEGEWFELGDDDVARVKAFR